MGAQIFFDNYSPAGDLVVAACCFMIFVLLATSYVNKTKVFAIYLNIVGFLLAAALSNVFYHNLYTRITDGNYVAVYILRVFFHAILFSNLLLYVVYIVELQRLERDKRIPIILIAATIYLTVIVVDIVTTINGAGFRLDASGVKVSGMNIFLCGYVAFVVLIVSIIIIFRKRLYKRVMTGFYGTIAISFWVLYMQGVHGQSSFTVASFLFPTIAMLYLIHSNPYDIEIGAISVRALEDMVQYNYKRGRELILMSLYLPDFDMEGKTFPKEVQEVIRRFSSEFFKEAVLFRISNGHIILVAKTSLNANYGERITNILEAFYAEYEKYRYDYKIVMGTSIEEISRKNEYVSFIRSIHQSMKMNQVHFVEEKDETAFKEYEYILAELADIYAKKDLEDERVLAYCQPVYHLKTGKYDTAEALMRLKLPKLGIVYPDKFISLAEDNGFIHVLTEIILHKTCREIKRLLEAGYELNRISVNISALEMRDEAFVSDVSRIIRDSAIPEEKIAMEITESRSDQDFMVLKRIIEQLKQKGILFYLDDFGTGYSNMERILELPFDIIKFDRSLVIASDANERSEKMVGSLAGMFAELQYSVLYEGVETEGDEMRCAHMSANYLQGYKYSRPVPISELRHFFSMAE